MFNLFGRSTEPGEHRKQSFKAWFQKLGGAVPLDMVPDILDVDRVIIRQAIRRRMLKVHAFRAEDGRVFHMVRMRDLFLWGKNPLVNHNQLRAMKTVLTTRKTADRPSDASQDSPRRAA